MERLTGLQHGGAEFRMVRRVGAGLRLNGKALIRMELAREEFTGVELQGRVVRVQRQADAAVLCHKSVMPVEHEAMVKVLRNGVRRAEVERALGRAQLAGGNELESILGTTH